MIKNVRKTIDKKLVVALIVNFVIAFCDSQAILSVAPISIRNRPNPVFCRGGYHPPARERIGEPFGCRSHKPDTGGRMISSPTDIGD